LAKTAILLVAASAMTIVLTACGHAITSQDKESGKTSATANSKATPSESQKPQTATPQVETSGTTTGSIDA